MQDPNDQRPKPDSLLREVGSGLKDEVRTWLRWTMWGAVLGAVVVGAAGAWYFGFTGLAVGAGIGAVAGGLGALLFYLSVRSEVL